jgi:hypothetical protein
METQLSDFGFAGDSVPRFALISGAAAGGSIANSRLPAGRVRIDADHRE